MATSFDYCTCPALMCTGETPQQIKQKTLAHSSNYIGISKKMAFGLYARTTPGLETFSGKKYAALQPAVAVKQQCFPNYWCQNL